MKRLLLSILCGGIYSLVFAFLGVLIILRVGPAAGSLIMCGAAIVPAIARLCRGDRLKILKLWLSKLLTQWSIFGVLIVLIGAVSTVITHQLLYAQTAVSTALYSMSINTTTSGTSNLTTLRVPFNISVASLIDGNFLASDVFNAIVQQGTTDVPSMPSSNRIQTEGAILENSPASFTEYTSASQNTTANDVSLLPAVPVVGNAFYFGCDNLCRVVSIDIDTAGSGTWTLTWEYWNGTIWTALTNVDDRTNRFRNLGRNTISWDMPTNWATRTVTGSSVDSFWSRARVSAFTSLTTQPLATRLWYETGLWWIWLPTLNVNVQQQSTLHFGGATNLTTGGHATILGNAGITTPDHSSIEPGGSFSLGIRGRASFDSLGSTICVVCKSGAFSLYPHVSGGFTLTVTGASTTTLTRTGVTLPTRGSQVLVIASDGTNLIFLVSDGGGMVSGSAQTVTNNTNGWTWVSNGAFDYLDFVRYDTVQPTSLTFDTTYTQFATGTLTSVSAYTGALGLSNP